MKRVVECEVDVSTEIQALTMPAGAVPIALRVVRGVLTMWCLVDADGEPESTPFWIKRTAWPVPDEAEYVDTATDNQWVYHLFRKRQS